MTSKERTLAALRRQKTDRVPVFMWFHPQTAEHLGQLLEIPAPCVGEALGNDIRMTWVNNNFCMEGITHQQEGESHIDPWGIKWVKEGPFNQIAHFPLHHATREEVLQFRFPSEHLEELLRPMETIAAGGKEYFIGVDVSPCVYEMYWRLRGMENALLDMAGDPELTAAMFARCADFSILVGEAACRRFKLDWFWTGDDLASQQALMMSPSTFRDLIKPELKRIYDVGKAHKLFVAYHCCGALRDIIPDLIEIGLDVLNPIQCNCPGMEPLALKRDFGNKLSFMGGVDTQGVLPHGTVAEVRRATARLIAGMTEGGGGYILAASHTIPPETPDENIFAMYAEAGLTRMEIYDRAASIRRKISATG